MRPPLVAPLAVTLLALSTPAAAGPVSQVANGIENKVETHQDSSGGASQSDNDNDSRGVDDTYYDNGCIDCGSGVFVVSDGGEGIDMLTGPARLDLYLGGHAVVDSQGALVGEIRLSKDWLGISASNTSYFEEVADDKGRSDSVRMDLMAFALNARLFAGRGAELWIDGGLAASSFDRVRRHPGHRLRPARRAAGAAGPGAGGAGALLLARGRCVRLRGLGRRARLVPLGRLPRGALQHRPAAARPRGRLRPALLTVQLARCCRAGGGTTTVSRVHSTTPSR